MKNIKYLIVFLISVFFTNIVYANDISKITMDIFIDNYGNAHVSEEWIASLSSGTEGYKPYYNLGNSNITNYTVSLNGKKFETKYDWDVNASFQEKSYKAAINPVDNGYELCFGISEYGQNTYNMKYSITNFVSQIEDADMVYWQLIPYDLSDKPEYVYIKIHSNFLYEKTLDVWGYGNYGGYAYVHEDGYIELIHEDTLDSDEYMTVLIKFPKNTFDTESILENNFEYYLDMANDGAKTYSDKISVLEIILGIFSFLISILPFIISMIVVFSAASISDFGTKRLVFNKGYKKIKKDLPYFRDIPCNKDIFKAYWVSGQYSLIKKKTDFLGAILLKWIRNKNVESIKIDEKKNSRGIKLISSYNLNTLEKELFEMMRVASVDGVLESNEFERWCKKNYKKILNWFNKVIDSTTMDFVENGLIIEESKTFTKKYLVNNNMYNTACEMAGLKKFLNEFSNISKREAIEVTLWEEYLMYAQIFGIAKKVAKEFKTLYPDVITDDIYDDFIFIHTISYSGVSAATTAKQRAESYSSGGGGFSSGGGGSGSFGGGGGGGFR